MSQRVIGRYRLNDDTYQIDKVVDDSMTIAEVLGYLETEIPEGATLIELSSSQYEWEIVWSKEDSND